MQFTTETTTQEVVRSLVAAYVLVADNLKETVGYVVQSDEDVDRLVYLVGREDLTDHNYGQSPELVDAYLLVWDCANGDYGQAAHEAARQFNRTYDFDA